MLARLFRVSNCRDFVRYRSVSLFKMADPVVTVEQGKLKGRIADGLNGDKFFSFQGIPYAKPPVGDLRFKAPLPAESWTGVKDATAEGSECISKHMIFFHPIGSEDCLSLNVYTPQLPRGNTKPKAVMVWIHGGGFTAGSSKTEIYGPEFLIKEDVVIVSINYRLGILGFLSLEDTSLGVPGNAGLKDMVLALKWVQKNISQFGGDPNNVTIFGESAGSGAVHFLILSPTAKGLFHRAILQSGVTLNPWAFGTRNAIEIAQVLGHESKNEKDALDFLKTIPAEKFLEAQELIKDPLCIDEQRPFSPVIEKPNPSAFLTEDPLCIMLSGNYNKVPMIIGYTSREGMLLDIIKKQGSGEKCVYREKNFERCIPKGYNVQKGTEASLILAKKIEDFYYGDVKTPEDEQDAFYTMCTDTYFLRGISITIKSFLKMLKAPIYFYRFSIDTSLNVYKKIGQITTPGASHADELGYLFKTIMTPEIDPVSPEGIAVQRITKYWTNFAKTGNPNPANKDPLFDVVWPKVSGDSLECLEFGEQLSIVKNPDEDRMRFWDQVSASLNSKL